MRNVHTSWILYSKLPGHPDGGERMTDGIRDALGMDTKNRTVRNLADSRQRERTRAEQVEQERDRLREERDRCRQTLIDLLQEVEPFVSLSKHLKREYIEAQKLLEATWENH